MSVSLDFLAEEYADWKASFYHNKSTADKARADALQAFEDAVREDRKEVWEAGAQAGRKNALTTARNDYFPGEYVENPYREDERTDQ